MWRKNKTNIENVPEHINAATSLIIASTARTITKKARERIENTALQAAIDETEYLNQATLNAAKEGKDSAEYWWSHSLIESWGTNPKDFAKAVQAVLKDKGYVILHTNLNTFRTIKDCPGATAKSIEIIWTWCPKE